MGVHIVNKTLCWSDNAKFGDKLNKGRGNLSQCDNSAHFVYTVIMIKIIEKKNEIKRK